LHPAPPQRIYDELAREEGAFAATLERGQKLLDELLARAAAGEQLVSGGDAFSLYDTYGFPLELTQELAESRGLQVGCVAWLRGEDGAGNCSCPHRFDTAESPEQPLVWLWGQLSRGQQSQSPRTPALLPGPGGRGGLPG
jgi:hypothetical protein